jgi:rhamnosyl/mannosyltransferase
VKVAFLLPCYWPEVRRGTERFARDLADGLIERGHRPRLITSHPGPPSTVLEDGLVVRRNWRPPQRWLYRLGFESYLTHWPLTYASLSRAGADLAHALHHSDALAAARWSRKAGRPSVFSYMGIPSAEAFGYRRLLGRVMRAAVDGTDVLVVLSQGAADRFRRLMGVDARVIHPGVNTTAFAAGTGRAERPTIFCAADVTEPRKRVPLLIEAFRTVRRSLPDARLVLSRPGDRAAADSLPGIEGVELRDVDDREALAGAYREAWVSALPSYSEAFGLVLAEALACGTPVVGSNLDGIAELIDTRFGGSVIMGYLSTLYVARNTATPTA